MRRLAMAVTVLIGMLSGCASPQTKVERVQLEMGQSLEAYRLLGVDPDGRARFKNMDAGDTDYFKPFVVAPGQSFRLEHEAGAKFPKNRSHTMWDFKVEATDSTKQQAMVTVTRTDD